MAIPPEIVDRIIDHVHDDTKTPIACSLTAKEWVPSTRFHLCKRLSLRLVSTDPTLRHLDGLAPNILHHCQELGIEGVKAGLDSSLALLPSANTPHLTATERIERLPSLHTLHFRSITYTGSGLGSMDSPPES